MAKKKKKKPYFDHSLTSQITRFCTLFEPFFLRHEFSTPHFFASYFLPTTAILSHRLFFDPLARVLILLFSSATL